MGLESLRPDNSMLTYCMLIAHERFQRNVRTHVHSFYFVAMPPSKRKMNGKSNVEQAGHVKAARARQAPAASSSASAGHEPERVPSRALPALLQALHVRF